MKGGEGARIRSGKFTFGPDSDGSERKRKKTAKTLRERGGVKKEEI